MDGEEQASASFATKIEQKIMNDSLQFLNIPPQGETDPDASLNKGLMEENDSKEKENSAKEENGSSSESDEKIDSDEAVPGELPESSTAENEN